MDVETTGVGETSTGSQAAERTIRVNGRERDCPEGWTVADLVATLGRDPRTVAVERNGEIVPRARWSETPLHPGDHLELVHFVQGG